MPSGLHKEVKVDDLWQLVHRNFVEIRVKYSNSLFKLV